MDDFFKKSLLSALNKEQYKQPDNPESGYKPDGKLTMTQSRVNTSCCSKPDEYENTQQGNNAGFSRCF